MKKHGRGAARRGDILSDCTVLYSDIARCGDPCKLRDGPIADDGAVQQLRRDLAAKLTMFVDAGDRKADAEIIGNRTLGNRDDAACCNATNVLTVGNAIR